MCQGWTVSPLGENFDPIHLDRVRLEIFPSMLEKCLVVPNPAEPPYTQAWSRANMGLQRPISKALSILAVNLLKAKWHGYLMSICLKTLLSTSPAQCPLEMLNLFGRRNLRLASSSPIEEQME